MKRVPILLLGLAMLLGSLPRTTRAADDASNITEAARRALRDITFSPRVKPLSGKRLVIAEFTLPTKADAALEGEARAFRASLETALINSSLFQVVERSQLEQILKELNLSLSDLSDPRQAQRVGKLLNADLMLVGEANRAGGATRFNYRLVQVQTAIAAYAAESILAPNVAAQPTDPGSSTVPTQEPPRVGRRALLVSARRTKERILKAAGFSVETHGIIPDQLDGYDLIWLSDWTALPASARGELDRYVMRGGGLVTEGRNPRVVGQEQQSYRPETGRVNPPWMGITQIGELDDAFSAMQFTLEFPDRFLGTDLSALNPTTVATRHVAGIAGHERGGEILVSVERRDRQLGLFYTYRLGSGHFFYVGEWAADELPQPLEKALLAGMRWAARARP